MKKICLALVLVLMIAVPGWATDWYVAPSGTNGDGSESSPWVGFDNVVWGSGGVVAGDTLWLMPGTYEERLVVGTSGSDGAYITIRGDYNPSQLATIKMIPILTGWDDQDNWTEESTNIWFFDMSSFYYPNPHRVYIDGTERKYAENKTLLSSEEQWWYDSTNVRLYLYSIGNPASTFNEIRTLAAPDLGHATAIYMLNKSYIKLKSLHLYGGNNECVALWSVSNVHLTECTIGYGYSGVLITGTTGSPSTNVVLNRCSIDTNCPYTYTIDPHSSGCSACLGNGVTITKEANHCLVSNSIITDWHNGVEIKCTNSSYSGVSYNEVLKNHFRGVVSGYTRAFQCGGVEGKCSYNTIAYNIVENTNVRIQVNGDHNVVAYNVIKGIENSPAMSGGTGQGIDLQGFSPYVCHDNKIINNTIINCDEAGIRFRNDVNNKENNTVANNIILNCGLDSKDGYDDIGLIVDNSSGILNNTFQNNLIYKSGVTNIISYRGTLMSVATWNTSDSNGDTIENNIQSDPFLTSTYHLSRNSPCIDAGTQVTGIHDQDDWKDLDGHVIHYGSNPDIGCYEYNTNFIKRWGKAKWNIGRWGRGKWGGARW